MRGGRAGGTSYPMAARPRCSSLVVVAGTTVLAGCGEAPGPDSRLKTPPPVLGAQAWRGAQAGRA